MYLLNMFIYLGVVAAGISGALIGIRKEMDFFGVLSLCVTTSLGGGILRDLLIGNVPPVAFVEPSYFLVSLVSALVTWFSYHKLHHLNQVINISDAIGLGVFTAVGSHTAYIHFSNNPFLIVSMGLITGIGGGVLRDVFAREIPYVFRKEIYAVASIVGSISFVLLYDKIPVVVSLYICLLVTCSIRIVSIIFKLNFPIHRTDNQKDRNKEQARYPL